MGQGAGGGTLRNKTADQLATIFGTLDRDQDRKLTGAEIPPRLRPFVARLDRNNDGALDQAEIQAIRTCQGQTSSPPMP